jgi:hypothetical protein
MKLAHWIINTFTCFPLQKFAPFYTKVLTIVGLCGFLFLSSCTERTSPSEDTAVIKASMKKENVIELTEEDIVEIKESFELNEKSGWYHHKQWGDVWPQRRTLFADINKTGYYTLCSNYYSKHGLDHDHIEVVVDDVTFKSRKVKLNSSDHDSKKRNGKTFEVNSYSNYGDEGILKAIAQSDMSKPITIRFIGKNGTVVTDELNDDDRKALVECFQMSILLRKENQQIGKR